MGLWTGFIGLGWRSVAGFCEHDNEHFDSIKGVVSVFTSWAASAVCRRTHFLGATICNFCECL